MVAMIIRDLLNLLIYTGVLTTIIIWAYKTPLELEQLKNIMFPMNAAKMIGIVASICFIVSNKIVTVLIIKLMQR